MEAALRSARPDLSPQSIYLYLKRIRHMRNEFGWGDGDEWLRHADLVVLRLSQKPAPIRRAIATACYVCASAMGYPAAEYQKLMLSIALAPEPGVLSKRQRDHWVDATVLNDVQGQLYDDAEILQGSPKHSHTVLALMYFALPPVRNDWGNVLVTFDGEWPANVQQHNTIHETEAGFVTTWRTFKNVKHIGVQTTLISRDTRLFKILKDFLPATSPWCPAIPMFRDKHGQPLSSPQVTYLLQKETSRRCGVSLGSQMLRVLDASGHASTPAEMVKHAAALHHSMEVHVGTYMKVTPVPTSDALVVAETLAGISETTASDPPAGRSP